MSLIDGRIGKKLWFVKQRNNISCAQLGTLTISTMWYYYHSSIVLCNTSFIRAKLSRVTGALEIIPCLMLNLFARKCKCDLIVRSTVIYLLSDIINAIATRVLTADFINRGHYWKIK